MQKSGSGITGDIFSSVDFFLEDGVHLLRDLERFRDSRHKVICVIEHRQDRRRIAIQFGVNMARCFFSDITSNFKLPFPIPPLWFTEAGDST